MNLFDITINDTLKEQLSEAEQITLQLLSQKVLEMTQSELPKHISSRTSVGNASVSVTSLKSVKTNDLMPAMLIKGTDTSTKKIPFLLLFKQATMRLCINQIMGLENDPQAEIKFDEFDLSAASEMMNAMFQQAAIAVSEAANLSVNGLTPSVGLFKNFGDFLQTLRLTSHALVAQLQFDVTIENEEASPCLIVVDFKALSKFLSEVGPVAMNFAEESQPQTLSEEPEMEAPQAVSQEIPASSTPSDGGVMSQDAIEAMLAKKAMESSPKAPEPAPSLSSGGGVMSQDAIEAMLAKKAMESSPKAPEPAPSPSSGGGVMSQDAIEAMLAKKAAESSPKAPEPAPSTPSSGGVMSQDAIEAMLAKKAAESSPKAPEPAPSTPSSGGVMSQDAIEAMLAKKGSDRAAEASQNAIRTQSIMEEARFNSGKLSQAEIEEMLSKKEQSMQIAEKPVEPTSAPALKSITSLHHGSTHELPLVEEPQTYFSIPIIHSNMDLVMNVPLTVSVEIGRTKRKIKEILEFQPGTVIELEKDHKSAMDVIVNGELFARGEVVVIDENFGIRLTEINTKKMIEQ